MTDKPKDSQMLAGGIGLVGILFLLFGFIMALFGIWLDLRWLVTGGLFGGVGVMMLVIAVLIG